MKDINVFSLAWKIFKSQNIKYFSIALKKAWIIVKRCKLFIEKGVIIVKAKGINKLNLFIPKEKIRDGFKFDDNSYNLKIFTYEIERI